MRFATTVPQGWGRGKAASGCLPVRRATAQPIWGDVLGSFTAATLRARPVRLCLVTPWVGETEHGRLRLLVRHADAHRAELVVVTRPSALTSGNDALDIVRKARAHRLLLNDQLHGKLYVCQEGEGRGVALVGSANLTMGGARLAEVGVLLRPLGGSRIIDDLANVAMMYLGGTNYQTVGRRA